MGFSFTNQYDINYLKESMMGPNAMRVTEELASHLDIQPGMRVLDLGCGMGLSSILLRQKHGATVFAADLWISPTHNYERFKKLGLDDGIIPVSVDATKGLPFAQGYFDMLVTVDSYHYYGNNEEMLPSLIPYVKRGGVIAVAVPGLKQDFSHNVPEEMQPFWQDDFHFYTCDWWKSLWKKEKNVKILDCREMECCGDAWKEWLQCDNPHAKSDIKMMEAENGNYFNLVQIIAEVL